MKRRLTTAVLALALLTACADPIKGVVTSKEHEPERRWTTQTPVYHQVCTGSGTSRVCTQQLSHFRTDYHVDSEDWILLVETEDGKTHSREVSNDVWTSTEIGDVYDETAGKAERQ